MIEFGSEQTIDIGERKYRLGKMRLKYIREFRDWIRAKVGDPFALVERFIDRLPAEQTMALLREAEEVKRDLESFRLLCPLGQRFLFTEEGLSLVVGMLLSEHHPGAGEDEVQAVADALATRMMETLTKAMGDGPNGAGPGGQVASPAESTGTKSTEGSGITDLV